MYMNSLKRWLVQFDGYVNLGVLFVWNQHLIHKAQKYFITIQGYHNIQTLRLEGCFSE